MTSATPQQGGPDRTSHDTTRATADPAPEQDRCVWDALVLDPAGREPLGDEPQFAEILEGMVADFARRVRGGAGRRDPLGIRGRPRSRLRGQWEIRARSWMTRISSRTAMGHRCPAGTGMKPGVPDVRGCMGVV